MEKLSYFRPVWAPSLHQSWVFNPFLKVWNQLKRVHTITNLSLSGHFCYTPEDGSNSILDNNAGCPIAFHRIGDKCYFYGYFKLNWFRAMEFCHSFGSTVSLACIETKQENEYLKNWLIEYGKFDWNFRNRFFENQSGSGFLPDRSGTRNYKRKLIIRIPLSCLRNENIGRNSPSGILIIVRNRSESIHDTFHEGELKFRL